MSRIYNFLFHKKTIRLVIALVIVLLIIYPFLFGTKKSYADEIILFPKNCQGNWSNAQSAAGDPAENDVSDGAQSLAVGDRIVCDSFEGSLPEGVTITDSHLEFIWSIGKKSEPVIEAPIEESYDTTPILPTESPVQEENIKQPSDGIETQVTPSSKEPSSRLPKWFQSFSIPTANAEEEAPTDPVSAPTPPLLENISIDRNSSEVSVPLSTNDTSSDINESSTATTDFEEKSSESSNQGEEGKNSENSGKGTSLFTIQYSLGKEESFSLGVITHEHLTENYQVPLTSADISNVQVSLSSLMTIDIIENLSLQGIELVVAYNGIESDDPIRQPNLKIDAILDDITIDDVRAIRIKRADNKEYEIWYQIVVATPKTEATPSKEILPIDIKDSGQIFDEEISSNNQTEPLTQPEIISPTVNFVNHLQASDSLEVTQSVSQVITSSQAADVNNIESINPISNEKVDQEWNFVAGDSLVHEFMPIALKDGNIFWLDKKGRVLNSFSILTQGLTSQSYQPEKGNDYIIYQDPTSKEKKAILNFSGQKFIFSE